MTITRNNEPKFPGTYTIELTPEQLLWIRNAIVNEYDHCEIDCGADPTWIARCQWLVHAIDREVPEFRDLPTIRSLPTDYAVFPDANDDYLRNPE
jgi:hypothetical protein